MKNEKAIEVLNSLITINNDRIEGYKTASEATEENDLKKLFSQFISTSQKCKQELSVEVKALGGDTTEGTKASGKFFRVWMDVKAALTGKDRKAILESCEYGEDKAKEAYADVIENKLEHLTVKQKDMIIYQKSLFKNDFGYLKVMNEELVKA